MRRIDEEKLRRGQAEIEADKHAKICQVLQAELAAARKQVSIANQSVAQ